MPNTCSNKKHSSGLRAANIFQRFEALLSDFVGGVVKRTRRARNHERFRRREQCNQTHGQLNVFRSPAELPGSRSDLDNYPINIT